MQTIPYSGLHIKPADDMEGYDEQKDLIERSSRKLQSVFTKNSGSSTVIRAIPTEEKGKLFTVFMNKDTLEFGLYSDGSVTQVMVYGHPPIRQQHLDRLCGRVENDLQGRLKYKDDPAIEKAWQICLDMKNEDEFAKAVAGIRTDDALQQN